MRRQGIVHALVAPDIKRQDEIERVAGKWKLMDVRSHQPGSEPTFGGELNAALKGVDSGKLGLRKAFAQGGEHSAAAASGIEKRKNRACRFDEINHVLA